MKLNLGDIIQIKSPKDEWNNKLFMIEYLDDNVLIILDQEKTEYTIDLNNHEIEGIVILAHAQGDGYAEQQGFMPNTWIEIEFKGTDKTIYRGKITEKTNDMIKIDLMNMNQSIYIDFEYKGLPRDKIRQIYSIQEPYIAPIQLDDEKDIQDKDIPIKDDDDDGLSDGADDDDDDIDNLLEIGEDLESIVQEVEVDKEKRRFDITDQTNDLLNDILASIPPKERKYDIMKRIHTLVDRFVELREKYSKLSEFGHIDGIQYEDEKPLIHDMKELSETLPSWILPVVLHRKTIFVEEPDVLIYKYQNDPTITFNSNEINENTILDIPSFYEAEGNSIPFIIKKVPKRKQLEVLLHNNENDYSFQFPSIHDKELKEDTDNQFAIYENEIANVLSFVFMPETYSLNPKTNSLYLYLNNQNPVLKRQLLSDFESVNVYKDDFKHPFEKGNNRNPLHFLYINENTIENDLEEDAITSDDMERYLDYIIPSMDTIYNRLAKQKKNIFSIVDVIHYLQYYNINYISSKAFSKIKSKIVSSQQFYREQIKLIKDADKQTKKLLKNDEEMFLGIRGSILYDDFYEEEKSLLATTYKQDGKTASEFMFNMMHLDHYDYLIHIIMLHQNTLYTNFNIRDKLNQKMAELENAFKENTCKTPGKIIAKSYSSIDELNKDDNTTIYFDLRYDDTPYSIMDEFKTERETMNMEQFREHIRSHLLKHGVTEDRVDNEVNALLSEEKKKLVLDGHYAIVRDDSDTTTKKQGKDLFFVRENNVWVSDDSENPQACLDKENCIPLQEDCFDQPNALDAISNKIMTDILKEEEEMKEEYNENIEKDYKLYQLRLENIHLYRQYNDELYSRQKYTIGMGMDELNIQHIDSPYSSLRDRILGLEIFDEKMKYIKLFIETLTKESIVDKHWLYCISTNVRLIPSFYKELTNVYTLDKTNYNKTLDKICTERGEKSEDGDKWIDKYSGYFIRYIDSSVQEEMYSASVSTNSQESLQTLLKEESKEKEPFIGNIIRVLETHTGAYLDNNYDFVYNQVIYSLNRINYKKPIEKHRYMILFIILFFLISVQTSVPPIKTNKTFPNCRASFSGFPYTSGVDEDGLEYMICIVKKISSSMEPWNSVYKMKKEKIQNFIKEYYSKKVRKENIIVKQRMNTRKRYDLEQQRLGLTDKLDELQPVREKWASFLPYSSISDNVVKSKEIDENMLSSLKQNIVKGNSKYHSSIHQIDSNIHHHVYYLQQLIQDILKKKKPILKHKFSDPFLENICCLEKEYNTSIQYFLSRSKPTESIYLYLKKISSLMNNIERLHNPFMFIATPDTREKRDNIMDQDRFSLDTMKSLFSKEEIEMNMVHEDIFNNRLKDKQTEKTISILHPSYHTEDDINDVENPILRFLAGEMIPNIKNDVNTLMTETAAMKEKCKIELSTYFTGKYKEISLFLDNIEQFETLKPTLFHSASLQTVIHSVEYMRSIIIYFIKDIPSILQNGLQNNSASLSFSNFEEKINDMNGIPQHWKLSASHNKQIRDIMIKYKRVLHELKDMMSITYQTELQSANMDSLDMIDYSIFDPIIEDLKTLDTYRLHYNRSELHMLAYLEYHKKLFYHMLLEWSKAVQSKEYDMEIQTVQMEYFSNIIGEYMKIIMDHKTILSFNEENIKEKIRKQKDKEKDRKTSKLQALDDDERQVSNMLQRLRLGEWSIGLQKGFKEYDPEFYDKEQKKLVEDTLSDIRTGIVDDVNNDFQDIYVIEEQRENEDLSYLANDDDHGNRDGDEYF